MSSSASRRRLRGRRSECETLDRLVADARAGQSQVQVLRGEPGVGKSALLEHVTGHAGCRVLRAAGVESEMELAFAGLHQLCLRVTALLDRLPGPQRDALAIAFGLRAGSVPDRFLVGLAVLVRWSIAALCGGILSDVGMTIERSTSRFSSAVPSGRIRADGGRVDAQALAYRMKVRPDGHGIFAAQNATTAFFLEYAGRP